MTALKTCTINVVVLLAILTIGMIATQTMLALFAIVTGILFLYYAVLLLIIVVTSKKEIRKGTKTILWIAFLLPLVALLIAPYEITEFMMQGIHLDMK